MAIAQKRDLLILYREVERLADEMLQQRVAASTAQAKRSLSKPSAQLTALMETNKLPADETTLMTLLEELQRIYKIAPQIRMTFANEPDPEALEKLVAWFRSEANPNTFLLVGIQPMLAGGCVIRTPRQRYDFSLRKCFMDHSTKLVEALAHVG